MQKLFATLVCLILCAVRVTGGGGKDGNDEVKIEGAWTVTAMIKDGKKVELDPKAAVVVFTFKDGKYTVTVGGKEIVPGAFAFYKIDAKMKPAHADAWEIRDGKKGETKRGIVKVEGDVLTLAYSYRGMERPKNFDAAKGGDVMTFKRGK